MDALSLLMLHICPFKECPWSYVLFALGIAGGYILGFRVALSKSRGQAPK